MLKKISCLILTISFVLLFSITAFASKDMPNLVDDANLLSTEEYDEVLEELVDVSDKFGINIAVVTVNGTNGLGIREFADNYQEEHYTREESNEPIDGALLIIDMNEREWYVTTCGEGERAFTDYGISQLNDELNTYFQNGDFAGAFKTFANTSDRYFEAERNGEPIDINNGPTHEPEPISVLGWIIRAIIAIAAGFGLSFAVTASMKKKMKTVVPVKDAENYIDTEKSKLRRSSDRFLYNNLVVIPLPRDNGPRGGSSTHISAGGFSHGGGGGHF